MSRANQLRSVWLAYVTLACSQFACAHHSPSEVIEALTEQMVAGQGTASLLIRRGDEYRAICDEQSAAIDYQAALELEPGSLPALYGLAHACFRLQLPDKASSAASERSPWLATRTKQGLFMPCWRASVSKRLIGARL